MYDKLEILFLIMITESWFNRGNKNSNPDMNCLEIEPSISYIPPDYFPSLIVSLLLLVILNKFS